jgi:hypothetical protein
MLATQQIQLVDGIRHGRALMEVDQNIPMLKRQ